jgi:hypothetical protein
MKVTFLDFHCDTEWETYRNGKVALQLVATGEDPDTHPGEPIATATVNTDHRIEIDEIIVKDYSENAGMVAALVAAGVIQPEFTQVFVGDYNAQCARCRLTDTARAEAFGLTAKA